MASDVLVESDVIDSPLSTVTTPSDDSTSDAVNTASARVYFGPLQSPEKRYAPRAGSARSRTPLRRSARFASKSRSNVNEEAYARSQDGTPLDEILQDEPSSVLASKILRAHDNPSPPPSPLPVERVIPPFPWQDSNILLDDVFESTQPEATNSPRGRDLVDLTVDQTAVSGNASRPSTITPQHVDEADSSLSDLITFDSFSSPSDFKARRHTTPARAVTERGHPIMTTVDDLLSLSPLPNLLEPRPTSPQTIPSAEECLEDVSPSTDEEMQVLATLTSDCAPPSPLLVADTLPAIAEAAPELPSILMPGPTTPVRSSTRPRRSCSPVPKVVSQTPPSTSVHDILLPPMPEIPVPDQFIALPPEESVQPDRESTEQPSNAVADVGNDIDTHTLECSEGGNSRSLAENSPSQIKSPVNDAPDTTLGSPKVKEKAGRLKRVSRAGADLGPLSPTSSNLLMQLLPQASGSGTSPPVSSVQDSGNVSELKPTTPPNALPTLSSVNLEEPAIPALTIQRPPSVPPTTTPFLTDASRTPARRIPISQAVAEGAFSAQKHRFVIGMGKRGIGTDVGVGLLGSPVFRRAALDDPTRSPAKRIPISEAVPVPPASPAKGKSVMRGQSPARMLFRERERSGSAEPKPLVVRKQRSASAEPPTLAVGKNGFFQRPPSAARSHVATCSDSEVERERKWGTLPFPIIVPGRVPPAIPEAEELDSGPSSKPLKPSPAKPVSSLRQPSAGSGSKIPRIGAKPYARPKAAGPSAMKETRMLAPTKRGAVVGAGPTASAVGPLRIVRLATGSGSSSDEGNVKATAAAAVRRKRSAASDNTAALSLKRKRDTEKPKPSPPPILVMRKVVPGMFAQAGKATSSSIVTAPVEEQAPSSPAKPQGPIKMRRVADWKRPPAVKELSRNDEVHAKQKDKIPENPPMPEPVPELDKISAPIRNTTPAASPPEAGPSSSTAAQPSIDSSPAPPSGVPTESEVVPARRTTRSRRKVDSTSDVFGTIAPASVRPLQIRRKHPLPLDNGPFSGMTALALKALTTANTNRNQQHVVSLKTEVIRKEGKRPESPTSKVRTVLERQKEEKVQQRKERAERRARRGGDGSGIDGMSDFDGASDLMDSSFLSVDRDTTGNLLRHRRGPGEDEDYVTPERPERPPKRGRFEEETEEEKADKRVKWDRGLATTVYLDDSPLKPRKPPKPEPVRKSCLTVTAKTLRLDTLGNVLNLDVPLSDLVEENIVVKKFVFDDDVEPEVASPAPKSTRSKTKKSKS